MNKTKITKCISTIISVISISILMILSSSSSAQNEGGTDFPGGMELNRTLTMALQHAGFTGGIEKTLEIRLGRPINKQLADLGRLIFFDNIQGLHDDNSCAGCHAPTSGFGDTQSIAIGVDNNGFVGPSRAGPRNQRRAPSVINSAFFPKLMWNGRFSSVSGDPFDNSQGFRFPLPEGNAKFPPNDPEIRHLLAAQGFIPQTELVEMSGFAGTRGTITPLFDAFDDGHGALVPPPDSNGFRNDPIRKRVLARFNASPNYRTRFGALFPSVRQGGEITFPRIGQALAEFQIFLTFSNAPIDRFARGERNAMTSKEKRGALLFFGKAGCVQCHAVAGQSNEMFSDFKMHAIGVPQIAPFFGTGLGNVLFDGAGQNEDFGLEQVTGNTGDRYRFRTSPLRNVALQPAFFHNGAFTRLEDAIRHHLDVYRSARYYNPSASGIDPDLTQRIGPVEPVLAHIDPLLAKPIRLTEREFKDLVAFVRDGLLDPRAKPRRLCILVPEAVPSGMRTSFFEGCRP